MKMNTEKERSSIVDKLIRILTREGRRLNPVTIEEFLDDDRAHNKYQTEQDYQKEQFDWLKTIEDKKK